MRELRGLAQHAKESSCSGRGLASRARRKDYPRCRQCMKALETHWETEQVTTDTVNQLGHAERSTETKRTGRVEGYGYGATGHFCSLRCGWRFAVDALDENRGTPGHESRPKR